MSTTHHHHHGGTGIGLGTLIAALLSWSLNHSVGWAILHGILGWIYILYWAICL